MLLLALIVYPSCRTQYAPPAVEASPALKELLPELPELPQWPKLEWFYKDGFYCLNEADVDKLLDFHENGLVQFRFQLDLYKKELDAIISHL